ncbi:MAG: efflux RND transporter periplasmic adaptor subunit [Fibrobacterota bacterium]|nr:efflux RND transporter periplasmic adaptor subunit [Chitinispirillaceae bacterium]
MKISIAIAGVIIVIAIMSVRLYMNHKSINKTVPVEQAVSTQEVSVTATEASKRTADQSLDLVGTLNAWTEIAVVAELPGKIELLNIEKCQTVSKGTIIASIDSKLKQLAFDNARINTAKLKNDFDRVTNLFKSGTASQQQLDDAKYSYENATIQLEQAQKQLSDASVVSPVSGIIAEKNIEAGAYVNTGNQIVKIIDISRFRVALNVSETNVYRLKIGDKATITTDVYPGITFDGCISFIGPQADATHNYPVEITINNSKEYPMKAGTLVASHITIPDTKTRLFIPRQSLQGSTKDARVFVIQNGKALLREIVVGTENGDYLEVLSGLTEKELVVTSGQINLSDGKVVSIVTQ